jgi:endo-1,4-beta-xylanase
MKKTFILILAAILLFGGIQTAAAENIPSLKEIYAEKFDFGAAAPQAAFMNTETMDLIRKQFSILTPENELKPNFVIDWAESRRIVKESGDETAVAVHLDSAVPLLDFAKENGIKVHGHVLVWHIETQDEFFHEGYDTSAPLLDRVKMLGRLENYIRELMDLLNTRYPGLVVSWDVVNEAIDDGSHTLRKSRWYETVGEDYVERAFELARKYAPDGTLLYYNDYNTAYPGKLKGILQLLEKLQAEGNIDGYGFQMHHRVLEPGMSMLRNAVKAVAATGLKLRVSELDVGIKKNTEEQFKKQAKKYADVMNLMLEYADQTEAVQVWGLTDGMSYRKYEYPLLFDASCNPKPAFWAVADPSQAFE